MGVFYCLGFVILRETHPFSRFPMYSSFPNWSYLFYFSDGENELIPSDKFSVNAGHVAHFYYSFASANDIVCGNFSETAEDLHTIGKAIVSNYVDSAQIKYNSIEGLKLHRVGFLYQNDSIKIIDELMYEKGN
jgi:hypothetical protein